MKSWPNRLLTVVTFKGISLDKLDAAENFVRQIRNDSVNPPLSIKIVRLMLPDTAGVEKPVLKIDIPRSLFVHKSPGGYFQRQGSCARLPGTNWLPACWQNVL
jgi:hypothetical protein